MCSKLINSTAEIIEHLGLPLEFVNEVIDLYIEFKKKHIKCISHFDEMGVIKCVVLCVARKNGYYVLINEILDKPQDNPSMCRQIYIKNKNIRLVYKKLRVYLNNPNYLNFNTGGYVDRVGQLLDLQHKDLEIIFANINKSETPVSILSKFTQYLDIDFDKLLLVKPTLSKEYIKNHF